MHRDRPSRATTAWQLARRGRFRKAAASLRRRSGTDARPGPVPAGSV